MAGEELGETEPSKEEVERASRGDADAAMRMVARWAPSIEQYLRRNAGRRVLLAESAADLAQSVCREALESIGRGALEYRGEAMLRQWLYGAADLKVKNRLRYYGAHKREHGADRSSNALDAVAGTDPSPSTVLDRTESARAFHTALESLEPRDQEIVRLFHFSGLSHSEIAERLEIASSHSRTILARSLARLARVMREA